MSDSGKLEDMESNYSGKFLVPSQPAVVPSPRSMQSRGKRMPFDTWISSETGKLFWHSTSTFDSSQTPYLQILHSATPGAKECVSNARKYRATCREK